jgi:ATP-dependent DNA helicase RecG
MEDLSDLVASMRAAGGDMTAIEVKSAGGGLPESLTQTLSALANLPGGGTIILGVDERTGFQPLPLLDRQTLKQGLASKARAFAPPVRVSIGDGLVDGVPVVVARVHECAGSAKPCRVASTGKAYLRVYDGDFELSAVEEQAFLAQRELPHFDRVPVNGATIEDLDSELVAIWLATVRDRDPRGLGRFHDDGELLRRAGVINAARQPTVAGLLALGAYPQEWFPRYVIQAAVDPRPSDPPEVRAHNQITITGPIPRMLDEAMAWARRSFDTTITGSPDGTVRDVFEYPLEAFRELVTNALVHRDLDQWSQGLAVEIRAQPGRLIIDNPGGLYGITVDRLGREAVTSARNARLLSLCQYLRSSLGGTRVIEALAGGLPIVTAALERAGLPPAQYIDSGIRFTVVLHRSAGRLTTSTLNTTEQKVHDSLLVKTRSVSELEALLGMAGPNIRKALRSLRARGLVEQQGGRGKPTTYRPVQ